VDTSAITTVPYGIRASLYFGYFIGYAPASVMEPGWAYWVKMSSPGFLVLHAARTAVPGTRPATLLHRAFW
jgi:hypothetical protein